MANSLNATYCNSTDGPGITLTCSGPECIAFINNPPFSLQCSETEDGASCSNSRACSGSAYSSSIGLTSNCSSITSQNVVVANATRLVIESDRILNGSYPAACQSATAAGILPSANRTASTDPAFSVTPPATSFARRLSPLYMESGAMKGLLVMLILLSWILPATAMSWPWANLYQLDAGEAPTLTIRETTNTVTSKLAEIGYKMLDNIDEGACTESRQAFKSIVSDLRSGSMDSLQDVEKQFSQGQTIAALNGTLAAMLGKGEDGLVKNLGAGSGGLDLLCTLEVHVLVNQLVDQTFQQLTPPAPSSTTTTSSSNLPTATALPGCNAANYSSSDIFYQNNTFGTDDWRDCLSCCVAWAQQDYAKFGGVCGCCILVS